MLLILAQSQGGGAAGAIAVLFLFLLVAAFYCYVAFSLQTIGKKLGLDNTWLAWIPIANVFFMLMCADKPLWWFVLMLIPIVSVVFMILAWMAIATRRGKPSWWGVLMIIPFVNLILMGYLAFAD